MVASMASGSVIVDMAAANGGNVERTARDLGIARTEDVGNAPLVPQDLGAGLGELPGLGEHGAGRRQVVQSVLVEATAVGSEADDERIRRNGLRAITACLSAERASTA